MEKLANEIDADRRDAVMRSIHLLDCNPVVFDTETTGIVEAEIVEIAAVSADGTVLLNTLVKPRDPITQDAEAIHGISMAAVEDAPTITDLMPAIIRAFSGRSVTSYALEFDATMVRRSCGKRGGTAWNNYEWMKNSVVEAECIMELYAQWYGDWNARYGSYTFKSLDMAAKNLLVPVPDGAHRALPDAQMALGVLKALAAWED